jgi:two-component system, LytTR family, response regulator
MGLTRSIMIRTVIIDDSELAREGIRHSLQDEPEFEVVGEAADGFQALDVIASIKPDLVFLDVRMPGLDGFQVIERVGSTHLPAIVFVTAYDDYAARAFDAGAIDYLLKPVSDTRFEAALKRIKLLLRNEHELEHALRRVVDVLESRLDRAAAPGDSPFRRSRYIETLVVKDRHRFLFVKLHDVDWIQTDENYLILHGRDRTYQARMTMADLEARLNPADFARIHRTVIVNLHRVREVIAPPKGLCDVLLEDGTKVPLGRAYRARLLSSLPIP